MNRVETAPGWQGSAAGSAAACATGAFSKLVKDLRFLYDGWNMTVELDHTFATGDGLAGSRPVREFFWGPDLSGTMDGAGGVGGLLAMFHKGVSYQVCTDANGNVSALYASSGPQKGTMVARFDYDPFGNRITNTGVDAEICPFGFSTKYRDEETGLLYYGYRYYSPEMGRWVNRDPIGERGGVNLCGMVGNDPVNRCDYLGHKGDFVGHYYFGNGADFDLIQQGYEAELKEGVAAAQDEVTKKILDAIARNSCRCNAEQMIVDVERAKARDKAHPNLTASIFAVGDTTLIVSLEGTLNVYCPTEDYAFYGIRRNSIDDSFTDPLDLDEWTWGLWPGTGDLPFADPYAIIANWEEPGFFYGGKSK